MTAVATTPPLRIDRYLALLALLLALVLGLLVIGERQRPAPPLPLIEGTLPPPASTSASTTTTPLPAAVAPVDREALLAEQTRLATRLRETESALRRAEAEIERLREENRSLTERLEGEGAALDELARRLAAVEADRDRLAAEVDTLLRTRDGLQAQLAELGRGEVPLSTTEDVPLTRDPAAAVTARTPDLQAAVETLMREQRAAEVEAVDAPPTDAAPSDPAPSDPAPSDPAPSDLAAAAAEAAAAARTVGEPTRLITFNGKGGTVADGVQAYRDGDFVTAERIWGALAASGEPRAQFHFGALMYEGRTAEPDLVMAYVWLSRAVDGGYLPARELRREVQAAMSEAESREALAIQSSS